MVQDQAFTNEKLRLTYGPPKKLGEHIRNEFPNGHHPYNVGTPTQLSWFITTITRAWDTETTFLMGFKTALKLKSPTW